MRELTARNPRTGAHDFTFTAMDAAEVQASVAGLRAGLAEWTVLSIEDRAGALLGLADALGRKADSIASALEADTGRRRIAQLEVDGAIAGIRGWAAQAGSLLPTGWQQGRSMRHLRHTAQFCPMGIVGVISPWNFPLTLSMIDTVPALLAGCAVALKPSEVTPRFADPLEAAIAEAGLDCVFRIVRGDGATGAALIGGVEAVCFTGSVATGRKVYASAAAAMIPAFLELGGKDALIVLDGADIEAATDAALRGSVLSTGQACQSIERIYVARAGAEEFISRLKTKAEAVRLNHPNINLGEVGPVIFERQAQVLQDHIDDAVLKGASVLTGGQIEDLGGGLYLRPTLIERVTHDMKVMHEETFGPIMPVMVFDTVEEAIALANDTEFGLSGAVFAGTLEDAEAVGRRIDAGAISLNDAALTSLFYEAEKHSFKLSGLGGSRMGPAGFQRFLKRKALIANTSRPAPLAAFAEDAG
jgi:acyl-CoA reductase-like NAD-dependent aldehyde dehydrogenase